MGYDRIEIDACPPNEDCPQTVDPDYHRKGRIVGQVYLDQIRRTMGPPPEGCSMALVRMSHDFGSYWEIRIRFEDDSEAAVDYAFRVEGESPLTWDDVARAELARRFAESDAA